MASCSSPSSKPSSSSGLLRRPKPWRSEPRPAGSAPKPPEDSLAVLAEGESPTAEGAEAQKAQGTQGEGSGEGNGEGGDCRKQLGQRFDEARSIGAILSAVCEKESPSTVRHAMRVDLPKCNIALQRLAQGRGGARAFT